ncbi:MAG: hypothetical protein RJA70_4587 [Pseudomonadota bacterium]|jgi:hypothetical protein
MNWLSRNYLQIDPRTLGFARIVLALVLLLDLAKRLCVVELWYSNAGLLPNHTALWSPGRSYHFSFLWGASEPSEAAALMLLIAVAYAGLLVGYRTRLCQVLSTLGLLSLQVRTDILSNGGDFVLAILCVWTAFLPMGRRFSVDAVLACRGGGTEPELGSAKAARALDQAPVQSLAVLALYLQIAVIYFFNAATKTGVTWRDGSAIHYFWHQVRMLTPGGLWARETLGWASPMLSWATLVLEWALPALVLSPWGKPWTRRLAVAFVVLLHGGITAVMNIGVFTPAMLAFSALLIVAADWDSLEAWAGKRHRCTLTFDPSDPFARALSRWYQRLDWFGRVKVEVGDEFSVVVAGERRTGAEALRPLARALPGGLLLAPMAIVLRPLWKSFAARKQACVRAMGWDREEPSLPSAAPWKVACSRGFVWAREGAVAFLIVVATVQLLNENRGIPQVMRVAQVPEWVRMVVDYTRLQQGWQMFAPDVPRSDVYVRVDAVTLSGKHVDPIAEAAGIEPEPESRVLPVQPGPDVYFAQYMERIRGDVRHHRPLQQWIERYHERTGAPGDRIVAYQVLHLSHTSPSPSESEPTALTHSVFVSGPQ